MRNQHASDAFWQSQGSYKELAADKVGEMKVVKSPLRSVNSEGYCQNLKTRSVFGRVYHMQHSENIFLLFFCTYYDQIPYFLYDSLGFRSLK